jgi:carbonic anhydrase
MTWGALRWARSVADMSGAFDDLLTANRAYSEVFRLSGLAGVANAGVAVVTCMDSRIDPLGMLGLEPGDAKVIRNPGGRVTPMALEALIVGVHLLGVARIMVISHTRCAMATNTLAQLRATVSSSSGCDASRQSFPVVDDPVAALHQDVGAVRAHPLIPDSVVTGGFVYDVDTGLLAELV